MVIGTVIVTGAGVATSIFAAYRWAKNAVTRENQAIRAETTAKIDSNFKEVNFKMDSNNALILEKLCSQDKQMDHIKKTANHIASNMTIQENRLTQAEKEIIKTTGVFKGLEWRVSVLEKNK